jgi:hypothetical protein
MSRSIFPQLVFSLCFVQMAAIAQVASTALPAGDQNFECNATPSPVPPGGAVTITVKPLRKDLFYAFGSSAGTLTVTGNTASLSTEGVSTPIIVICSAVDSNGNSAQATVTVGQQTPAPSVPFVSSASVAAPSGATQSAKKEKFFNFSGSIAPTLSWTTGTQTQTISGGSLLLADVHSKSNCDSGLIQLGLGANASDTGTTKLGGATTNLDNNDLKLNATSGLHRSSKSNNSYLGIDADFFGNNSLGIGLQQTYTAEYQYYLTKCKDVPEVKPGTVPNPRFFASVGIGAGYMDQRLYKTQNTLGATVLPLSAQFSYLQGNAIGIPPKFIVYGLVGYMPVLSDLHAYQVGATAGLQLPTKFRWMTVNLTETDLYMNNAPTGFKRNYQNGSVAFVFSIPKTPPKVPNLKLTKAEQGACYGGDKLARLYCYDSVTADSCAPPNIFRASQHCASSGGGGTPGFVPQPPAPAVPPAPAPPPAAPTPQPQQF